MMQTCPKCGFEAQPGARFCRQCGGALFAEREETLAATKHHLSQTVPPQRTGWAVPVAAEQSAPQTASFVRSSSHAPGPVYGVPQPSGTPGTFWALVATICGIATAGLLSASLLSVRVDRVRGSRGNAAAQIEEQIRRVVELDTTQAEKLARVAEEKARVTEELARAKAELIPSPPAPPAVGGTSLSIEEMIYPGAVVSHRIKTGNEVGVVKMQTSDDLAKVRSFYTERLGPPQSSSATRLVFSRSAEGTSIVVKVSPSPGAKGPLEISLVQASLPSLGKTGR